MNHYRVFYRVQGYCNVDVLAESINKAADIADQLVTEMDFGSLEDIEWKAFSIDENN